MGSSRTVRRFRSVQVCRLSAHNGRVVTFLTVRPWKHPLRMARAERTLPNDVLKCLVHKELGPLDPLIKRLRDCQSFQGFIVKYINPDH
jgi:hypothetical protein